MWPFKPRAAAPRHEPVARPAAQTERKPLTFGWADLAGIAAPELPRGAYRLPEPPPGVVPDHQPLMAQDDALSGLYGWAGAQTASPWTSGVLFPGYQVLAEMAQIPEYRRGSAVVAEEMTRKWIKLKSTGEGKLDRITALNVALEKFQVRDVFQQALLHDGLFGIGHIYLDMGEADDSKPLIVKPQMIGRGKLKGIRTVEPMWCYPAQYNSTFPLREDFYRPNLWYVMGKPVHCTRLLNIVAREVPDLLKPAYMFGGLPRTLMAQEAVQNFRRTRQSVSDLIAAFSNMILKTDLSNLLNTGATNELLKRVVAFITYRSNRGLMVVDKTSEDISNVSTPLGGLDALQAQSQEQIASVQAIPITKLLGVQPAGLNASADGEIRTFYDSTHAENEKTVRVPLKTVLDVIQLSEFGDIDPDITFDFEPLWQMSARELAEVQKMRADTDAIYMQEGVINGPEVRDQLVADETSPYHGLTGPAPDPDPEEDEPLSLEELMNSEGVEAS